MGEGKGNEKEKSNSNKIAESEVRRTGPGISQTGASLGSTRCQIAQHTSLIGSGGVSEILGAAGDGGDAIEASAISADVVDARHRNASASPLPAPPPSSPSAPADVPVGEEATALPPPQQQPSPRGAAPPILSRKEEEREGKVKNK